MTPPVFAALNVSSVRAFVGTNPARIYQTSAPQNAARPHIVWQIIAGSPTNNLSEDPDQDNARVRVWCYCAESTGAAAARNLALSVRAALEAVTHVTFGPIDDYETEADGKGLFVWIMDAEFWTDR